ncbi:MAG: hypothetical protein R6X25_05465 [Candidatus Krumholzibacteriia bacterium]
MSNRRPSTRLFSSAERWPLISRVLATGLVCLFLAAPATLVAAERSEEARIVAADDLSALRWRPIGPASMSGRVSAIALVPGSRTDFYVGYATGGLFRTTNLGTTFEEVFRNEETSSIGAVAAADAPADWPGWTASGDDAVPETERLERGRGLIVWVGTGEGNNRNSSSWGHGVYRSTDGGGSFTHLGLAETHDIPRLAVDPRDPDVCYVAALGHLWGPNPERGIYRTRDGGGSWQHVLKVDDQVGACDVVIDPAHPETVYAALYARRRTPWSYTGVSDRGGIFRSDDAGDTWRRLTAGLPERTGRIGLTVFPGDPTILYAVVESDQGGIGRSAWDDRSPAGGLFRSDDGGASWRRVHELNFRPFYFSRVAVDPEDPDRVYMPGWDLAVSEDGGRTFRRSGSQEVHVDHHAIAIDPADPQRILLGTDGGLYVSHDRAATWDLFDQLDVGQFYHVDVDLSDPYRVGGGLQDNGSWIGPSASGFRSGSDDKPCILNEDWTAVYGGDGFRVAFDPTDPDVVYATAQGGHLGRVDLKTHLVTPLRAAADEGQEQVRFNWDAPFLVSRHDPTVLYHAGARVYKLTHKGDYWYAISDDLSRREVDRVLTEGSDAETYGTVTALAESPLQAGRLWAGTDDGRIHVTSDDGGSWREVTPKEGGGLYVAHLEASGHDGETVYVAIDGHRSDDFRPRVFTSENLGRKWRDISGDLPAGSPVRVVREDPRNRQVLYCGNEQGAYVTLDGGRRWLKLGGDSLPTVPVYDLVLHPRENDLVAATHGRSIWILDDVTALSGAAAAAREPLHLFPIQDAAPRLYGFRGYGSGHRVFRGQNPPDGAVVTYWLREMAPKAVSITVKDAAGLSVRTLEGPARPGLNRAVWDLQADEKHRFGDPRRQGPDFVEPGEYTVTVKVGDESASCSFAVAPYPGWQSPERRLELPPARP